MLRFLSKTLLNLSSLLLAFWLTTPLSIARAESTKKIADLEVKITDPALIKKDANIHTMFIVLYDPSNSMPMPYGALKVELAKDASGTFYKGALTTDNVMLMSGDGSALPKEFRIKARLDKDGSAGGDEAGDLVGLADKVALGSKAVITINKAL